MKGNFPPLSIQTLIAIRKNQLSLWNQKRLPETELVRRQEAILSAGHFEAYNYWLFKGARADEFSEWIKSHQDQLQAWLDWQSKNKFAVETPDFQRLYLLRNPSRSSAAPAYGTIASAKVKAHQNWGGAVGGATATTPPRVQSPPYSMHPCIEPSYSAP